MADALTWNGTSWRTVEVISTGAPSSRATRDIRAIIRDMAANAPGVRPGTFLERLYMTRDEHSRGRWPQPCPLLQPCEPETVK
jgi:hypothetical protein